MKEKSFEEVIVIKRKKDIPTVIQINGKTYIFRPENKFRGSHRKRV